MEKIIENIYEMLYESIITPYNLLENSKLDNYTYVKYYKKDNTLVAEMECLCGDDIKRRFFYEFDAKDSLARVTTSNSKKQIEILFDRRVELERLLEDYKQVKRKRMYQEAI